MLLILSSFPMCSILERTSGSSTHGFKSWLHYLESHGDIGNVSKPQFLQMKMG